MTVEVALAEAGHRQACVEIKFSRRFSHTAEWLISTQRRAPAGRDVVFEERHALGCVGEQAAAERAPAIQPRRAARACVEINQ